MEAITSRGIAMEDDYALRDSYRERFQILNPQPDDWETLGQAYIDNMYPGVRELIEFLKRDFQRVILISAGPKQAIKPFAQEIGILPENLFAINLIDDTIPPPVSFLYEIDGKRFILHEQIKQTMNGNGQPQPPSIMIGDGRADAATKGKHVKFIAVGTNKAVMDAADFHAATLNEIPKILTGQYSKMTWRH